MRFRTFAVAAPLASLFVVGCSASSNTGSDGPTTRNTAGHSANAGGGTGTTGGGTGTSGTGGGPAIQVGGGGQCVPSTCADLGANCGVVTDTKCGGVVDCSTCPAGQSCGIDGKANQCGTGQTKCVPKTCDQLSANCGKVNDGCSNLIDCGTCSTGTCGGDNVPNQCGMGVCTPQTCADQAINCGPAGDGCGGSIPDCGSCMNAGESCGGGGKLGVCGAPACTKLTCAAVSVSCGSAPDGCNGTQDCGGCEAPQICGGGNKAGVCGCTGICATVPTCTVGDPTTLKGTVYDPAGATPLYNVLVYVPNQAGTLPPLEKGLTCDQCGSTAAGDPLVTTYTKPDGTFELKGVPIGDSVPLVIQLGRWRRQFTVSIGNSCGQNNAPDGMLTMPKNKGEGDIPRIALLSGTVDSLECVLRKIGLDQSEFGDPGAVPADDNDPRVQFYLSDDVYTVAQGATKPYGKGAAVSGATPNQATLFSNATLNNYDMALLACPGFPAPKSASEQQALEDYATAGGRVFTTHYSYPWLTNHTYTLPTDTGDGPYEGVASWNHRQYAPSDVTATIDTNSNPKGKDFKAWLDNLGALDPGFFGFGGGTVDILSPRWDSDAVQGDTQQWIYAEDTDDNGHDGTFPLHFTFNTPVGADATQQCGRVLFSDFHVLDSYNYGETFPSECNNDPMTAQEKILEFMIFDLSSCVEPYKPVCTANTCAALGVGCGPAGDGCGGPLDCGECTTGTCGGGGVPGQCGAPTCTPKSCLDQGINCGPAGDGCGLAIDCGTCKTGMCGGGGKPGVCGTQMCMAETCTDQGIECGPAGDGCGLAIDCGKCGANAVCGLTSPGKCGTPKCTPTTCAAQGVECGPAGDGCGLALDCGNCKQGDICGLNAASKCGTPAPPPELSFVTLVPLRPSSLIELRESPGRGRGVFALDDLPEGTIVEECPVIVVPEAECDALVKTALVDYYFGWGGTRDDAAIALGYGSLFNHSPHPNAMYVRKTEERTIFFVTIKAIAKDEEITVSYRGGFGDPGPVWFEAK